MQQAGFAVNKLMRGGVADLSKEHASSDEGADSLPSLQFAGAESPDQDGEQGEVQGGDDGQQRVACRKLGICVLQACAFHQRVEH